MAMLRRRKNKDPEPVSPPTIDPTDPPDGFLVYKIVEQGVSGFYANMLCGISIQQPLLEDANGDRAITSEAGRDLPYVNHVRYHAGTDSYSVTKVNDDAFVYVRDTVTHQLYANHHFTFGPQLMLGGLQQMDHINATLICLGNEPMSHLEKYQTFGGYLSWVQAVVNHPENVGIERDKLYIQSGRPDFYDSDINPFLSDVPISEKGAMEHRNMVTMLRQRLDFAKSNREFFPRKLCTTFKILPSMVGKNVLPLVENLLGFYASIGITDVMFSEFKLKDNHEDTYENCAAWLDMCLILCRLAEKLNGVINITGMSYQQGWTRSPGGQLINMNRETRQFFASPLLSLFNEFFHVSAKYDLVITEETISFEDTPIRVELFEHADSPHQKAIVYVNYSDQNIAIRPLTEDTKTVDGFVMRGSGTNILSDRIDIEKMNTPVAERNSIGVIYIQ